MGKILIEKSGIFTEISGGTQDTPQQLLAKILIVDGKGSGLDADLLGGVNYSQYALKKDYYDRNIINTELSKKLNISDYNNEKSTFALKTEVANSNKPVYVVSDTEPIDKNVFWITDEEDPTENVDKSLESLKKSTNSNLSKIQLLENELQTLKSKLNSSNSSSTTLSQPRPNLLMNGDFSFCRTALYNNSLIEGVYNNVYYSDYSTKITFTDKYIGMDSWNMFVNYNIYTNYKIECSISKDENDVSNSDILLTPKYLKINSVNMSPNQEKIILYQNLLQLHTNLLQQKENNLDFVISGIIKQKNLDFDYEIYLLYDYDYTSQQYTKESTRVKLDKEYIDNTGKTPITINYNVFENINLKIDKSTLRYDLVLVIEITPKNNTNKFSKTNSTNPICIGNLKLELVKKNEEKTPTLFSYYNNSYADDDIASMRYMVSFYGNYFSHLCSDNKHRLTYFLKNDFYGIGLMKYPPLPDKVKSEKFTKNSITLVSDNNFSIRDFYLVGGMCADFPYKHFEKKYKNWF